MLKIKKREVHLCMVCEAPCKKKALCKLCRIERRHKMIDYIVAETVSYYARSDLAGRYVMEVILRGFECPTCGDTSYAMRFSEKKDRFVCQGCYKMFATHHHKARKLLERGEL